MKDGCTALQRLPGREEACLSCMAWAQDPVDGSERLFTGGLDGALTEWDLRTRQPRHVGDSFGGAVWALAAEPRGQLKEGEYFSLVPAMTQWILCGNHVALRSRICAGGISFQKNCMVASSLLSLSH